MSEQANESGISVRSINTVGKDGTSYHFIVEQFKPAYQFPHSRSVHTFKVRVEENSSEFFAFDLLDNVNELKVISMFHGNQIEYMSKGIPEEMIRRSHEWLGKKIISSNNLSGRGEFRSDGADKAWKRLVATGEASYDKSTDTYTYPKEK